MKNTTTTQHTQGEWKWNDVHDCTHTRDIKSGGKTIATVWVYDKGEKVIDEYEAQTNAEHIVKCVNTHDALINALEVVLWYIENGEGEAQKQGRPRFTQTKMIITEALKNAK